MKAAITVLLTTGIFLLYSISFAQSPPQLPKNYHSWQKSERKIVTDKSSLFYGIHYMYADKKAMQGYRSGNKFAEGSTIVVDFFNIKQDPAVDGPKNMVALMRKDKRAKQTGGWVFAGYGADGKPSGLDPVATCFGCHQKDAPERDFIISTIKDFQK